MRGWPNIQTGRTVIHGWENVTFARPGQQVHRLEPELPAQFGGRRDSFQVAESQPTLGKSNLIANEPVV